MKRKTHYIVQYETFTMTKTTTRVTAHKKPFCRTGGLMAAGDWDKDWEKVDCPECIKKKPVSDMGGK